MENREWLSPTSASRDPDVPVQYVDRTLPVGTQGGLSVYRVSIRVGMLNRMTLLARPQSVLTTVFSCSIYATTPLTGYESLQIGYEEMNLAMVLNLSNLFTRLVQMLGKSSTILGSIAW